MEFKTCTKCGQTFPATTEFFYRRGFDRLHHWCKACAADYNRKYCETHKEQMAVQHRAYHEGHKEEAATNTRAYREAHKEELAAYDRVRYETHKEQMAVQHRAYRETHKEEAVVRDRAYREAHPAEIAAVKRAWGQRNRKHLAEHNRQRLRANPQARLNRVLAQAIGQSLHRRKAGNSWETLVGYTLDDLMRRLESRFQSGMTFENYGKWHMDHICPLSAYSFTSTDDLQFKECWALSNLQPLWAKDNMSKGAKWQGEQESIPAP